LALLPLGLNTYSPERSPMLLHRWLVLVAVVASTVFAANAGRVVAQEPGGSHAIHSDAERGQPGSNTKNRQDRIACARVASTLSCAPPRQSGLRVMLAAAMWWVGRQTRQRIHVPHLEQSRPSQDDQEADRDRQRRNPERLVAMDPLDLRHGCEVHAVNAAQER
jgi:hypothetical protein